MGNESRFRLLVLELRDLDSADVGPFLWSSCGSAVSAPRPNGVWEPVLVGSLEQMESALRSAEQASEPFSLAIILDAKATAALTASDRLHRLAPTLRQVLILGPKAPPPSLSSSAGPITILREPVDPQVLDSLLDLALDACAAERKLATLTANLPGMAYRCLGDARFSLIYASDGAEALTGATAEQLLAGEGRGFGFVELIHPDDRAAVLDQVRAACQDRSPFEITYRIVRTDGAVRWVWERGRSVSPVDVAPPVLDGFITDIHNLKMAQSALRDSEEGFRSFLDQVPGGAFIKDAESRLIYANAWYLEQLGKARGEVLERPPETYLPADLAGALRDEDRQVMTARCALTFEREWSGPRGRRRYLVTKVPLPSDGGPLRIAGLAMDITDQRDLREHLNLFQYALDHVTDCAFLVDAEGRLHYVNLGACRALGYDRDVLLKMVVSDIDPYLLPERWLEIWEQLRDTGSEIIESLYQRADGSLMPVEVNASFVTHQDGEFVLALARDLSERQAIEQKRRQSDAAFENSADGILITDPRTRILSVNRAFSEITGYGTQEVQGQTPSLLRSGRHDAAFFAAMWASIEQQGRWQGEVWNRRKDGSLYPARLTITAVRDRMGVLRNYVGVLSDITAIKRSQQELERLAHHDLLTGLPNRLLFDARLIHALERARRDRQRVILFFLDLDHFKEVNDSQGHLAGDELLRQVAERLTGALRKDDTVARLGGDEFAVILERVSTDEEVARLAGKLVEVLRRPFDIAGHVTSIGTSLGIARYPDDGSDASVLLRCADSAMYGAKNEGRNTFRFFGEHRPASR
ncbi:PAS domain S-box protein [Thioalkalicoccus limnaeus]|uniref:PAS domain S-box protein n=1 Tax=Thioalkalicoccus limnaeus TaxID=120681 RepID=A0ABV4BB22_9GAMM